MLGARLVLHRPALPPQAPYFRSSRRAALIGLSPPYMPAAGAGRGCCWLSDRVCRSWCVEALTAPYTPHSGLEAEVVTPRTWACSCGGGGGSCGGWCLVRTRAQMLRPRKPGSGDKGGKEVSGASKPSRGRPSRARPARAVERKLRQARADRPAVQGASFPHGSAPHRCKWVTIRSLSALAAGAAAMELFRVAAGPACCSRMPLPTARAAQVRGATHHQTLHLPGR